MRDRTPLYGALLVAAWLAAPTTESPSSAGTMRLLHLAQAADSHNVIISEVLFAPITGETTFVELTNVGRVAVDLSSFILRIDTLDISLPRLASPLARGARALVRFDGRGTVEDNVVHTSTSAGLRADSGSVTLLVNDDRVIDRVAWGTAEGAIMPSRGGIARGHVEPGSSFGRPPGAERPGSPADWVIYPPEQVTPGQPNPLPAVVQLLPMEGAVLPSTTVALGWYTVPGAARYRVQLAADTTFAQPLLNQLVDSPPVSSGQLAAGTYWWRVQAIPADGPPAAWSRPNRFDIEGQRRDGTDAGDDDGGTGPSDTSGRHSLGASSAPVILAVPLLVQHKDSPMLLLESQQSGGPRTAGVLPNPPHTWDGNHQALNTRDPADNMNCGLASMAMVNHFYGGDLTQDRIGYEVFSKNINKYAGAIQARAIMTPVTVPREKAVGPERDLNYGYGVTLEHLVAAGLFALGALPGPGSGDASTDDIWKAAKSEIDAGRPLIGYTCCHAFVIRGYEMRNGERLLYVNDPWSGPTMPGQYSVKLDAPNRQLAPIEGYFSYPIHPGVSKLEPNFWKDNDRDDVSDFDEINRFQTNPNNKDSDADGVPDKQDIESGIYELEHTYGYAWNPAYGNPGRDVDGDGKPTELDPDSDDGGCKDGDEDTDFDGYHTLPESGNFDRTDDECGGLQGNVSFVSDVWATDPYQIIKRGHTEGTVRVRLKPESPGSDHYVDDSSSFWVKGYARLEIDYGPRCIVFAREHGAGSGTFANETDIGATRGDDGSLAFSAEADLGFAAQATAGGCGVPGGSGRNTFGLAFPDCQGVLSPKSPPGFVTYRFNCNRSTNQSGFKTQLVVKGYVRFKSGSPHETFGPAASLRTFFDSQARARSRRE